MEPGPILTHVLLVACSVDSSVATMSFSCPSLLQCEWGLNRPSEFGGLRLLVGDGVVVALWVGVDEGFTARLGQQQAERQAERRQRAERDVRAEARHCALKKWQKTIANIILTRKPASTALFVFLMTQTL